VPMALLVRQSFTDRITEHPLGFRSLPTPPWRRCHGTGRLTRRSGVVAGRPLPGEQSLLARPPGFSRQPLKFRCGDRGESVAHRLQKIQSFKGALQARSQRFRAGCRTLNRQQNRADNRWESRSRNPAQLGTLEAPSEVPSIFSANGPKLLVSRNNSEPRTRVR
jgi:hypothetical protein